MLTKVDRKTFFNHESTDLPLTILTRAKASARIVLERLLKKRSTNQR